MKEYGDVHSLMACNDTTRHATHFFTAILWRNSLQDKTDLRPFVTLRDVNGKHAGAQSDEN